ncbi:hypothetical protein EAF04_006500 [Stromatinia cepivora]|nr:hypothetical protein EAF04_006500 [Stromatinia cepivora]
MHNIVPCLKKFKARRAHAKELRMREDELKISYRNMKAVDELFKNTQSQTYRTHTEQNTYADKTRELGASTPQAVVIRRPGDF